MFDIGWPELFLIGIVVLLVVGPKDLPGVIKNVGAWVGKARAITREFTGHLDEMVRESELNSIQEDIEKVGEDSIGSFLESEEMSEDLLVSDDLDRNTDVVEPSEPREKNIKTSGQSDSKKEHDQAVSSGKVDHKS